MTDFVRGLTPEAVEELPRFLEELGLRIEEAVESIDQDVTNAKLTATTAELIDITDSINTSIFKKEGFMVFNETTNAPVWAVGDTDAAVWNDATGTLAHTPV